jgi:hypothetical protein
LMTDSEYATADEFGPGWSGLFSRRAVGRSRVSLYARCGKGALGYSAPSPWLNETRRRY